MSNRASIESLKNSYNDKVLYISEDYLKLEELKDKIYIRADFPDELLRQNLAEL